MYVYQVDEVYTRATGVYMSLDQGKRFRIICAYILQKQVVFLQYFKHHDYRLIYSTTPHSVTRREKKEIIDDHSNTLNVSLILA